MAKQAGVLAQAKERQTVVFRAMDALSKRHGPEVFRILGQRYFKTLREQAALRREIAEREKELQSLQRKASR